MEIELLHKGSDDLTKILHRKETQNHMTCPKFQGNFKAAVYLL